MNYCTPPQFVPMVPHGSFVYVPGFLTWSERDVLLDRLRALHFDHNVFRGQRLKRGWAQFGYQYLSTGRRLVEAPPLPPFLARLIETGSTLLRGANCGHWAERVMAEQPLSRFAVPLFPEPLIRHLVEHRCYVVLAVDPDQHVTAFKTGVGEVTLSGLIDHYPRIARSITSRATYGRVLAQFRRRTQPSGQMLNWACRSELSYLDLTTDRMELSSAPMPESSDGLSVQ